MLHVSPRDRDLLQFLDRTPATAALLLKVSSTFAGETFRDERRVRERLQQLAAAQLVRRFSLAQASGGAMNYYKLTPSGFALLHGPEAALPPRAFFAELPLSRLEHTMALATVIGHTLVTAFRHRVAVTKFHRENELTLAVGPYSQQPDFHMQFHYGGRTFNVVFEVDQATESIDSFSDQSIRQKLLGYEAYQDMVWHAWKHGGEQGMRPYFKVVFLTTSTARSHHILSVAAVVARNRDRRLCYAATQDEFLAESDAIRTPLFLDHFGGWQALVNLHPTSRFVRESVKLTHLSVEEPALW